MIYDGKCFECDDEFCSDAYLAFDVYWASLGYNDLTANAEPETNAKFVSVLRLFQLLKVHE